MCSCTRGLITRRHPYEQVWFRRRRSEAARVVLAYPAGIHHGIYYYEDPMHSRRAMAGTYAAFVPSRHDLEAHQAHCRLDRVSSIHGGSLTAAPDAPGPAPQRIGADEVRTPTQRRCTTVSRSYG